MLEYNNYTVLDDDGRENCLVCIFPDIEYQEIKGFGGAFTEAASTTLDKLSKENRDKIIKLYFDRSERAITATNKKYGKYCFAVANSVSSQSTSMPGISKPR